MTKYQDLNELLAHNKLLDGKEIKETLSFGNLNNLENPDWLNEIVKVDSLLFTLDNFLNQKMDKVSDDYNFCFKTLPSTKVEFVKQTKQLINNCFSNLIELIDWATFAKVDRYYDIPDTMAILNKGILIGNITNQLNNLTDLEYEKIKNFNQEVFKNYQTKPKSNVKKTR